MDSRRWEQVEDLFRRAVEQPEKERASWLDQACAGDAELRAEVASLIDSDAAAAGVFVSAKIERAVRDLTEDPRNSEGSRIGPYRLIRELGRGGMGTVYLAARADEQYESDVAIKLVSPGPDTDFILKRFRRERQILARLQHPNIAKLFDGGTTDDETPYLVMEYVDGLRITEYASRHALSLDDRLRLFLDVCAAVEYAHRNFIVHRDLKPANILVDASGTPKLLDFGISKLLLSGSIDAAETQGVGLMTPDYASPEQILGEPVTIASDVYSLGAVLYELLTSVRPHRIDRCTPLALERAICLEPTVLPSHAAGADRGLSRRLAGDLDNILLKAMQKEPERRYLSAEHLAVDLRRYMEHRPVLARADSFLYRAGKYLRRNRIAVAIAVPVLAAIVIATGIAIYQARIAQQRFSQVRKLATTFVFDVGDAARDLPGAMKVRELIAKTGLEYLDNLSKSASADQGLKRELATAFIRIADVQGGTRGPNLGDSPGALASYRKAAELLDSVLASSPGDRQAKLDRLTVFAYMGDLLRQIGNRKDAAEAYREGLRRTDAMLSTQSGDIELMESASVFHMDLAQLLTDHSDLSGAMEQAQTALPLMKRVVAARPDDREALGNLATAFAHLGSTQASMGDRDGALKSYRAGVDQLESMQRTFPNDLHVRHELMLAYSHVGDLLSNPAYDNLGNNAPALDSYGKMVSLAESIAAADPRDVRAKSDQGIATLRFALAIPMSRLPEKRETLERAHRLLAEAARLSPLDRATGTHKAWTEFEIGEAALAGHDRTSAVSYYQAAMDTAAQVVQRAPRDHRSWRYLIAAGRKLSEEQARTSERTKALAALDKVLAAGREVERLGPPLTVALQSSIARAWEAAGSTYMILASKDEGHRREQDEAAAREWYQRAMDEWHKLEPGKDFAPFRNEMEATKVAVAALNSR